MRQPDAGKNTPEVLLGTAHAAGLIGCDPSTLRDYERRGIVAPLKGSTGRRLWRMADVQAANAYRAGKRGK